MWRWKADGRPAFYGSGLPSAPPLASPADHCCRQCVRFSASRGRAVPKLVLFRDSHYISLHTKSSQGDHWQPFTRSAVGSAADPYGPAPARRTCRTCAQARPTRFHRVRRLDGTTMMSGTLGSCLMCASPFGHMSRSSCHLNAVTLRVSTVSSRGVAQLLALSALMRAGE